jgi:vitamin B12 transporter
MGTSAFYAGNPGAAPGEERAAGTPGADHGISRTAAARSRATWFENRFRDLIVFDFGVFPGTTANVERARTRGLEVKSDLVLPGAATLRLAYTFLEADNLSQAKRLLRRPRHSGSLDLGRSFGPPRGQLGAGAFNVGAGLRWIAQREDVHAATFLDIDGEDYSVVRAYAAWQVNDRLTLRARVENLLDERYEDVHGFPQPGLGAYAGVEWRF